MPLTDTGFDRDAAEAAFEALGLRAESILRSAVYPLLTPEERALLGQIMKKGGRC